MDREQAISERVREAFTHETRLRILGGGSKAFYGGPVEGETLGLADHSGVISYDPGELVLSCRAGTRLAEIRDLLAEHGQHLPFDPPAFGAAAKATCRA